MVTVRSRKHSIQATCHPRASSRVVCWCDLRIRRRPPSILDLYHVISTLQPVTCPAKTWTPRSSLHQHPTPKTRARSCTTVGTTISCEMHIRARSITVVCAQWSHVLCPWFVVGRTATPTRLHLATSASGHAARYGWQRLRRHSPTRPGSTSPRCHGIATGAVSAAQHRLTSAYLGKVPRRPSRTSTPRRGRGQCLGSVPSVKYNVFMARVLAFDIRLLHTVVTY